jgi:predicted amidohydrolase YtcJ
MAAAIRRSTAAGEVLGAGERMSAEAALAMYLGRADDPGGPPRRVEVGAHADLCLLKVQLGDALADPSAELVRATFVGGRMVCGG